MSEEISQAVESTAPEPTPTPCPCGSGLMADYQDRPGCWACRAWDRQCVDASAIQYARRMVAHYGTPVELRLEGDLVVVHSCEDAPPKHQLTGEMLVQRFRHPIIIEGDDIPDPAPSKNEARHWINSQRPAIADLQATARAIARYSRADVFIRSCLLRPWTRDCGIATVRYGYGAAGTASIIQRFPEDFSWPDGDDFPWWNLDGLLIDRPGIDSLCSLAQQVRWEMIARAATAQQLATADQLSANWARLYPGIEHQVVELPIPSHGKDNDPTLLIARGAEQGGIVLVIREDMTVEQTEAGPRVVDDFAVVIQPELVAIKTTEHP